MRFLPVVLTFLACTACNSSFTLAETLPGQSFRECAVCPEMTVISSGTFVIGSPAEEKWRNKYNESPRATVNVSKFAIGVNEVTFAEWDSCVEDGGCRGYRPEDSGWGRGLRPVIFVSKEDALAFIKWINSKVKGAPYRLPTEAEWEYAARGGTSSAFWTGKTISTNQANFDGNYTYGGSSKGEYRQQTVIAGSLPANPFGLHEVLGNVWEWVQDCWNETLEEFPTDGSARVSGDCTEGVLRGGAWNKRPFQLRSAQRFYLPPTTRQNRIGFRLARTIGKPL